MPRGILTPEIQKIANKHIGRDITQIELRLIPYVQYVMCNNQRIEPAKIRPDERDILQTWRDEEHIEGGASGLAVTKEFWDFMCEILFESYVKDDD